MASNEVFDVIIIGGGPAGMSAAIYTARAELSTLVIDKQVRAGALGITSKVANYPGIVEVLTGEDVVKLFWKQAESFGTKIVKDRVTATNLTSDPKVVITSNGSEFNGKTVILAAGAMGRDHVVPGEQELLGKGVSYCATCDGAFFKNQEVIVIGDGVEAIEEAQFLTKFASKVYLATPKSKFFVDESILHHLKSQPKIEVLYKHRLNEIVGSSASGVSSVILGDGKEMKKMPINGVFIFTSGSKPIIDFITDTIEKTKEGYLVVDHEMKTSIPGVYACGDLLKNAVKQAVVAAADGCIAALAIDKFLHNRKDFKKDYY